MDPETEQIKLVLKNVRTVCGVRLKKKKFKMLTYFKKIQKYIKSCVKEVFSVCAFNVPVGAKFSKNN